MEQTVSLWGKQGYVESTVRGWTLRLSQAMSQRDYLHSRAIKSSSPHLWSRYKKLKNYVNKGIQKVQSGVLLKPNIRKQEQSKCIVENLEWNHIT